jgi:hypothetical protein
MKSAASALKAAWRHECGGEKSRRKPAFAGESWRSGENWRWRRHVSIALALLAAAVGVTASGEKRNK